MLENIFLLLLGLACLLVILALGAAVGDRLTRRSTRRNWRDHRRKP